MKKQKKTACPLCFPPNRLEGLPEGFIIGSLEQYCLAIISAGPQMIEQTGSMHTRMTRPAEAVTKTQLRRVFSDTARDRNQRRREPLWQS